MVLVGKAFSMLSRPPSVKRTGAPHDNILKILAGSVKNLKPAVPFRLLSEEITIWYKMTMAFLIGRWNDKD
jgi:hypothetical protein